MSHLHAIVGSISQIALHLSCQLRFTLFVVYGGFVPWEESSLEDPEDKSCSNQSSKRLYHARKCHHNPPAYHKDTHIVAWPAELGEEEVARNFAEDVAREENSNGNVIVSPSHVQ